MLKPEERDEVFRQIREAVVRQLIDERGDELLRAAAEAAVERDRASELLTAAEVARMLRTPEKTVAAWGRSGQLSSVRIGKRRLYARGAVRAFIAAREGRNGTERDDRPELP